MNLELDSLQRKTQKMQPNMSVVRQNAEKDSNYAPYCLRCSTMRRMTKIESLLWRCKCGAIHDERVKHGKTEHIRS